MELELVLPKRTRKKLLRRLLTGTFSSEDDQHGGKKYREMGDGVPHAIPLHSQFFIAFPPSSFFVVIFEQYLYIFITQ
jgi:hypothetical protein